MSVNFDWNLKNKTIKIPGQMFLVGHSGDCQRGIWVKISEFF